MPNNRAVDNCDLPPGTWVPTDLTMMGFQQLVQGIAMVVPAPVLWLGLVMLVILGAPPWYRSVRARQMRGALRRAARAPSEVDRRRHEEEAFTFAQSNGLLLVNLADTAIKQGQWPLARRALETLDRPQVLARYPGTAADVRRLRGELSRPEAPPRDILSTVVHVEALLAAGVVVRARDELATSLTRFPHHPELLALSARLEAACPTTPSVDSSTSSSVTLT